MKLLTTVQAAQKLCPFDNDDEPLCMEECCMMWTEVHSRVEREDHSGASEFIQTQMMTRGQVQPIERSGPPGSEGVLSIDALGHCAFVLGVKNAS